MSGILLVADTHFGMTTHDGPDFDGSPSWRQNEARRVARFIYNTAHDLGASIVVAGDMFHSVRPQAWAYQVAEMMDARNVIPGNHDWPVGEGVTSPLANVEADITDTPTVVRYVGLDVALLPWFGRAFVAATYPDLAVGEQNRYMMGAVERIVADLASQKREGVPLVLVTHFTIGGATYNSDVQPQIGESNDFMIPAAVFDDPRIDHVFSGHIHKPQDFGKVTYIGSPVRSDFGEAGQATRVLHIENVDGALTCTVIPTPAVEFVDVPFSIDSPLGQDASLVRGKVVRIAGEAAAGEQTAAALASMTAAIEQMDALHVAKPAVKFTRHEARAVRLIEVDASPADALRSYAEMVGGEYATYLHDLLMEQSALQRGAIA